MILPYHISLYYFIMRSYISFFTVSIIRRAEEEKMAIGSVLLWGLGGESPSQVFGGC